MIKFSHAEARSPGSAHSKSFADLPERVERLESSRTYQGHVADEPGSQGFV